MKRRLVLLVLGAAAIIGALLLWHSQTKKPGAPAGTGSSTASTAPTLAARKLPDPTTLARGSIAGKISDDKQVPIAGARVCAVGSSSELADELVRDPVCAVADAGGAYRLQGLYPARYIVSASAKPFRPAVHGDRRRPHLTLAAGEHKTAIDIALRGDGVEVTGTVADITGGPITNARVRSQGGWWGSDHAIATTETDAAGKFSLWVAPGRTSLVASADGYAEGNETGRAPGTFEILLTPESTLAGTVVDAASNQPIADARVTVGSSEWDDDEVVMSDDKGAFRVARIVPGRVVVMARTERGFGRTEGSVLVGLGQHVDGVVVKLFAAQRIAGRVVIAATKQPCPDASVTLQPKEGDEWIALRQRDDGLQFAEGVLPGEYTPQVRCRGYRPRDRYEPIVIADREPAELVWEVDTGAAIRGKVMTKAGAPVEGANLWAQSIGGPPRARSNWGGDSSGADGAYELAGLKAGTYRLEIQTEVGVPPEEGYRVEVSDGATVTQDIQLDDGGTLNGAVVDAQGKPLAGISVSARPLGGGLRWMRAGGEQKSDDSGSFTFESLRAGEYRITAQRGSSDRLRRPGTSDDEKQGEKVVVRANQVATVRLVVENASGTITGSVIDHDGKPIADAFVNAARESDAAGARASLSEVRWSWDERPVVTGTDGTFALTRLAPGNYTIRAYRKGGGEAFAEHVAVGKTTKLQIKLTGSIEGLAKRTGGVPDKLEVMLSDPMTGFWRSETFYKTAGRFALREVPKGSYKLTISGRGSQKQIDLVLAEAEAKTGVTVELDSLVTVTGRVVELGTQNPVPGIRMNAALVTGGGFTMGRGNDDESVTDEAGRFKIVNAPRGRLQLTGFAKDFRDSPYSYLSAIRDATGDTVDVGDVPITKRRVKLGEASGELGVNFADQPEGTPPDKRELKVSYIDPRGAAAKTDLKVGDVIVSVDGVDITGGNATHAGSLMRAPPGTKLALGLARGATVTVTLAAP
jgi:hypothetical protein